MRIAGVALLLLTVATPMRAEADVVVCRMSGAMLHACCCASSSSSASSSRSHEPAALERRGCCDAVHLESNAPPSRVDMTAAPAPHASPLLAAALVTPPPFAASVVVAPAPAGPNPRATAGPPRVPVYLSVLHLLG